MNWYTSVNNISETDNFINKSVYGGVSTQGEGIDLRQEMHWILYGKENFPTRVPKGHWIVYRRFTNTISSAYSKRTHEGIGAPGYTYTDILVRTRKMPLGANPLLPTPIGSFINDLLVYFFEYNFYPKIGDSIFELEWDNHMITPTLNASLKYTDKYKITAISDYRLENGNIQFFKAQVVKDEVTY